MSSRAHLDTGVLLPFLVVVGVMVTALYVPFSSWAYDDPFITFRYAQNLRAGLGFVYNPGERILSTTTPLYTLLLAGLSFLWSDLPRLSTLISALSLGLGALALYWLGQWWDNPMAGLMAALLYPLAPMMVTTFGAETCFYVTLILWAFALYARGQDLAAMALAALATLTRADGVLAGAVIGLALVVRERRIPWKPLLLFGLLIAPWYLFSWFYFGSPFSCHPGRQATPGPDGDQRFVCGGVHSDGKGIREKSPLLATWCVAGRRTGVCGA
jgi:uncharacterized membrane protein